MRRFKWEVEPRIWMQARERRSQFVGALVFLLHAISRGLTDSAVVPQCDLQAQKYKAAIARRLTTRPC